MGFIIIMPDKKYKIKPAPKGQVDKYQGQKSKAIKRLASHGKAATIRSFKPQEDKLGRSPKQAKMPSLQRSAADPRKPAKSTKYKF